MNAYVGRLNVLANVVRKPMKQIFSEFAGAVPAVGGDGFMGTGDVKYHLGTSYDRPTVSGKRVHLSLLANPSHLEVRLLLDQGWFHFWLTVILQSWQQERPFASTVLPAKCCQDGCTWTYTDA